MLLMPRAVNTNQVVLQQLLCTLCHAVMRERKQECSLCAGKGKFPYNTPREDNREVYAASDMSCAKKF